MISESSEGFADKRGARRHSSILPDPQPVLPLFDEHLTSTSPLLSPTLLSSPLEGIHELGKKKTRKNKMSRSIRNETPLILFIKKFDFCFSSFTASQTMRPTGFRRGAYIRFFNVSFTKRCMPAYTLTVHTHIHNTRTHLYYTHGECVHMLVLLFSCYYSFPGPVNLVPYQPFLFRR